MSGTRSSLEQRSGAVTMRREIKYHYYAFMEISPGQLMHWDGVAEYSAPILDNTSYVHLKSMICPDNSHKVIISSLTVISDVTVED